MDYGERLAAIRDWMEEHDVDLVILFDRANTRYLTGFRLNRVASSLLVVDGDGEPTYIVAQLDLERARRDCWIENIVPFPEDTPDYLAALAPLFRAGVNRVGVERDRLSLAQAERLSQLAGAPLEYVDVHGFMAELRVVKSEAELEQIRTAASIADRVMEEIAREVRPGVTEQELAGMVEYLLRHEGAEGPSFEPFFMSGETAWLPQRVASGKVLASGELALLDMGAVYGGYCSDLTRTFAVGEVSERQRRIFRVAREAQAAAIEAIRPGVVASAVDQAAREVIEAAGLGRYFPHITGHGVGVSIHEAPILGRGVDLPLRPGMVVTVEPGVYVPGLGAARVEDMVVVTATGCEVLTNARRDLV